MRRRRFLAMTGLAGVPGAAGCTGGSRTPTGPTDGDELPADDAPDDGFPPRFETTPDPTSIDTGSFPTTEVEGVHVPLAPIDVVYRWYGRRDARFVDARGPTQFLASHVYGAVNSPAPDGAEEEDPVDAWPSDARIVCYCGCPHHLSSLRAASLISAGYGDVSVIDEGFWEWQDREYPMAGQDTARRPAKRDIRGRVNPRFAGGTAWARHPGTGQVEATAIGSDGRYHLEVRFAGLSPASTLVIETPAYRVSAPLDELTRGVVTG